MDNELELKIYKNYRAMMKKRNKGSAKNGYPSYWRQLAREACVNRYNVSFAEVKRIVAKYDAVNGITHEKTNSAHNSPNNLQNHIPQPEKFLDEKAQLKR